MITLKTADANFGPFISAVKQGAGWLCDGIIYPQAVVGDAQLVQGVPDLPPAPRYVPDVVPMLNAQTAMFDAGWLTPWLALLDAMEGDDGERARIKWRTAQTVRRDDPLVILGTELLGHTPDEADDLFIAAAALVL